MVKGFRVSMSKSVLRHEVFPSLWQSSYGPMDIFPLLQQGSDVPLEIFPPLQQSSDSPLEVFPPPQQSSDDPLEVFPALQQSPDDPPRIFGTRAQSACDAMDVDKVGLAWGWGLEHLAFCFNLSDKGHCPFCLVLLLLGGFPPTHQQASAILLWKASPRVQTQIVCLPSSLFSLC